MFMETYTVTQIIPETPEIKTIRFIDSSGAHPDFEPGQYITVQFPDLNVPEGKAYSISSIPSDPFMSITVKSVGDYSRRLCNLKPGDTISLSQPYGFLFEDTGSSLVCIGAGVGVSPLWSIIRGVLDKDANRKINLLHGSKTIEDIVFHDIIKKTTDKFPSLTARHFITRQTISETDRYKKGRINSNALNKELFIDDPSVVICGNQDFVTDIYKHLISTGVSDDRISTEIFFNNHERQ